MVWWGRHRRNSVTAESGEGNKPWQLHLPGPTAAVMYKAGVVGWEGWSEGAVVVPSGNAPHCKTRVAAVQRNGPQQAGGGIQVVVG